MIALVLKGGLCVSFDDRFAVSVKLGDPGQLFDIQTGRCYMLFAGHTGMISAVKFNQKLLVSAGSDATLRIWEISSGRCERVIEGHLGEITCLQLDDDIVISGSEDHTAKVYLHFVINTNWNGLIYTRLKGLI